MEKEAKELLEKEKYDVMDLVRIVTLLRRPGGCPWDREQTHESIRKNLIEETYEVIEAIDKKDLKLLREELGDLLLQVVFHAEMEAEAGHFTFDDVAGDICRKLIHRHPHVFGEVRAENSDRVLENWEAIKNEEKHRDTVTDKLMAVPRQLPALMRAAKVGKKSGVLDFPDTDSALLKVREETGEAAEAIAGKDAGAVEEEVGDLLFAAANLARKASVDPEEALTRATDKYIRRFSILEVICLKERKEMALCSPEELDFIWEEAKKIEKSKKNADFSESSY